ncbi:MAG: DNA replication and repair protein RecF [Halieaceae bacterium]|nr:DNA replication and repair protein RecF [Halieaceae bacterium]
MLTRVQIVNFRNIATQHIGDLSVFNVFLGDNGAGKTSVLEAIHTLGHGRSFRKQGGQKDALVSFGSDRLVVFGEQITGVGLSTPVSDQPPNTDRLGLSRLANGDIQIKINGAKVHRLSDMALRLPALALNSDTFDLLTGAAAERRRYIDWAVFHVEHDFNDASKRYSLALQQRNSIMRRITRDLGAPAPPGESVVAAAECHQELSIWTDSVAELGETVAGFRHKQFGLLNRLFLETLDELGGGHMGVQLGYRCGWNRGATLQEALKKGLATDLSRGFTQCGPHRADVQVLVGKTVAGSARLARDILSRGQLKLVVLAMKLAQVRYYQYCSRPDDGAPAVHGGGRAGGGNDGLRDRGLRGETISLLLDDVSAEFDGERLRALGRVLGSVLASGGVQVFATTTSAPALSPLLEGLSGRYYKVFHVEHGVVSASE